MGVLHPAMDQLRTLRFVPEPVVTMGLCPRSLIQSQSLLQASYGAIEPIGARSLLSVPVQRCRCLVGRGLVVGTLNKELKPAKAFVFSWVV